MNQRTLRNLLSLVLVCCIGGLYCVMYMFHIFNMVDQVYVPEHRTRWVIEEPQTLVSIQIVPPLIAADTYATEEEIQAEEEKSVPVPTGLPLTAPRGVTQGPSGKETWYNLPMDRVIESMRNRGYTEDEYAYSIREDGVKMFGDYIMVAADLNEHSKGDIVDTSLGLGIVCDTGDFANTTDVKIDIATNW